MTKCAFTYMMSAKWIDPATLFDPALEAGLEEEVEAALEVDHAARVVECDGDLAVHEPPHDAVQVVGRRRRERAGELRQSDRLVATACLCQSIGPRRDLTKDAGSGSVTYVAQRRPCSNMRPGEKRTRMSSGPGLLAITRVQSAGRAPRMLRRPTSRASSAPARSRCPAGGPAAALALCRGFEPRCRALPSGTTSGCGLVTS